MSMRPTSWSRPPRPIGTPSRNKEKPMDIRLNDILVMKKPHPCGNNEWEILRIGADFRIKCCKCGHLVMLPRPKFEKGVKKIIKSAVAEQKKED